MKLTMPPGYRPCLDVRKTEAAIPKIKRFFQEHLAENLNLERASAPLFVKAGTGINDDLNGTEKKVGFAVKDDRSTIAEVVNSLAKWKRMALARYGYNQGEGIWTDMNAIRPDEELDNIHSLYVDQWDWERVINVQERNAGFLKGIVEGIYLAIRKTEKMINRRYGKLLFKKEEEQTHLEEACSLQKSFIGRVYGAIKCAMKSLSWMLFPKTTLPKEIIFITSEELEQKYPNLSRKEREDAAAKEFGALFLMKIGWPLADGKSHDGRAPDYDDWNLNGDIIVWNPILQNALELSSMGIRVDKESLMNQLRASGSLDRVELDFHKMLLSDELPLSIGGGIGQSRLSMFLLRKAHIGEVQASIWPQEMVAELEKNGTRLL